MKRWVNQNGRGTPRRALPGLVTALLAGLLLTGCGGAAATGGSSGVGVKDFKIVAYQGDAILGGHESSFSRVFQQGKPVVLNFWAGLCPPCRAEMPGFQRVADQYQGKVIFVGVDVGPFIGLGSHQDAVNLYSELHIRYPLAYAVDASPLQLYNVVGMPTTVFLTPRGESVDNHTGILTEDGLRDVINNKLLKA